ncbi:MAG: DUF2520 domain-containing protein [Ignavibacteriales bacterium]|nr:MAG: DUF2520 domain-containing protein [Ignavibacteriales bacterium]
MRKSGFNLAFIGAGKVAWSLIPSIREAGYNINFISSSKIKDAEKAAVKFHIAKFSDSLKEIPPKCNIVFLTIPDDQLKKTAEQISKTFPDLNKKLFIHVSGVYSSDVIKAITKKGGKTASFHIMQTFPSKKRVILKKAFVSVETSDNPAKEMLFRLAEELGMRAFSIKGAKTAYHLSGVIASNFLTASLYNAEKLFRETGSDINFFDFIGPIINKTFNNCRKYGPVKALSGPVERGDIHTVKMHVKYLRKNKTLLLSYLLHSLNLVEIKKEQGKAAPALKEIESYLKFEMGSYLKESSR